MVKELQNSKARDRMTRVKFTIPTTSAEWVEPVGRGYAAKSKCGKGGGIMSCGTSGMSHMFLLIK